MKNPLEGSSSLSTPGLLIGKILEVDSQGSKTERQTRDTAFTPRNYDSLERSGLSSRSPYSSLGRSALTEKSYNSESNSLTNTYSSSSLRRDKTIDLDTGSNNNSLKRRSLLDNDNWLSLERKKGSRISEATTNPVSSLGLANYSSQADDAVDLKSRGGRPSSGKLSGLRLDQKSRSQSPREARLTSISPQREKENDDDADADVDPSRVRSFWRDMDRKTSLGQLEAPPALLGTRKGSRATNAAETTKSHFRRSSTTTNMAAEELSSGKMRRGSSFGTGPLNLIDREDGRDGLGDRGAATRPRSRSPNLKEHQPSSGVMTSRSIVESERDSDRRSRSMEKKWSKIGGVPAGGAYDTNHQSGSLQRRGGKTSRRGSLMSTEQVPPPNYDRSLSPDYDRGQKRADSTGRDSNAGTLNRRDSSGGTLGRRGSRRLGVESPTPGATSDLDYYRGRKSDSVNYPVKRYDPKASAGGESKHFLSLQIFTKHAEPGLDEFLPVTHQLELENRQREEEDALYRKFLQERREQEDVVASMSEEDREELFLQMNKMERSRVINLAEKHCSQMMDLIHREKIRYLEEGGEETAEIAAKYPRAPPPLTLPQFTKQQVYENNMAVFETVDETAKEAAKDNYKTFTNLVRFLVGKCSSDLDKARAIFKYITEKEFKFQSWFLFYPEEGNTRGAPTQLLRGVEFGIETKALLYKRMCAYAGLHAIVIKGYCKAKDYLPGDQFTDTRWRNAWNAVYVAGDWRLVQPNWAAMQVNTKAARETRKIYQDHYFLTDPDKFIFEFYPMEPEHQFLDHPISKEEFEMLPLLRSTFFHFGLGLARSEGLLNSVIKADNKGEANIYINSQDENVSFHYTLMNMKTGSTSVKAPGGKFPLGRFVMMSTRGEETNFNIHIPQKGTFLLEIGAAWYPTSEDCLALKPIYYINVCKFKIICEHINKMTVPLPDCVPGEWGPNKALQLFGLRPTSHPMPVIYAAPPSNVDLRQETRPLTLNIEFEKTRPVLDFVTKLYKNGVKEEELKQGARYRNKDQYVIFDIKVPQDGQYGLDIYTRQTWDDKMLHCCKYLINCDL